MIQLRTSPKTVALADPRWCGHHPTYFTEFTASLLRLGHRVIALCRKPEELGEALEPVCEELGLEPSTAVILTQLDDPDRTFILPGHFDHDPISTIARWRCLSRALRDAESGSGWRADFVFLPWLDSYLRYQPSKSLPSLVLGRPWGGLYFRTHHLAEPQGLLRGVAKGDRSLRNRECRAVGVLDERFSRAIETASERPVFTFPDITDETPALGATGLVCEIRERAAGRKIIGMVGLEQRKGFLTMLRIAEAVAGREDWYFVAAGVYCPETCDEEQRRFAEDIERRANTTGELDNVFMRFPGERVPDGAEYNTLLSSFDLVYAAYEDFYGSSNALTKAAVFHRPILATRGECIGDRVEEFDLGLTIPQADVAAGEEAIRRILAGIGWDGERLQPRYSDYHAQHDRDRLDAVFAEILNTLE